MNKQPEQVPAIEHDIENQIFQIEENGKQLAYIRYRAVAGNSESKQIDFYTTFVAPESRGRGIAKRLVEHALDWADSQQYQIQASCWYAADILAQRRA